MRGSGLWRSSARRSERRKTAIREKPDLNAVTWAIRLLTRPWMSGRMVKKLERLEMVRLRILHRPLFECASPTQKQRLHSRFHEVIDNRGIQVLWACLPA